MPCAGGRLSRLAAGNVRALLTKQLDSALYLRLDTSYDLASQHVAHFGLERLPIEESAGVDYMSIARLRAYAGDVFGAMR